MTKKVLCLIVLPLLLLISPPSFSDRMQPENLEYQGAFRLPDDPGWEYSGYAMTYYPNGDPDGGTDGYPGSLYIIGHDHTQRVSEIAIPPPTISNNKNPKDLETAETIQPFNDIRAGLFPELEIPRAGIAYLPKQGAQVADKLYFCWGQHFQDNEPSHGWCELDLATPQTAGPWHFGGFVNYTTNDYLFDIPKEWADKNVQGQYLATGRFRDGLWSGKGPALYSYAPWKDGSPPTPGTKLQSITPLLLYGTQTPGAVEVTRHDNMKMVYFQESDEWSGASWLTSGNKSALVFVGTKATGKAWYGFSNGVVYPISGDENEVYPEVPPWPYDDRGWWSENIQAQLMFYDTDVYR